jgi:hypothetical protein
MNGLYIPVYVDTYGHPKFKRLVRTLELPKPHVAGCLIAFWLWVMKYYPDGEITDSNPADIAEESFYDGDPDRFVNGLLDAGFLEPSEWGFHVHNWNDYGGKLVEKRQKDTERKRRERTSRGYPPDVTRMSDGFPAPNRIEENRIEKSI